MIKIYGDRATGVGPRQVDALPSTKAASPPIQTGRFFRNGKAPDASAFSQLNTQMNQAMLFRTKEALSMMGDLGSAPGIQATSAAGTRKRWRFAFHTSPYAHALLVRAVMFPPSSNYGNDTYATLKIYSDANESTLISTTEFHYGPGPSGSTSVGGWQYHRIVDKFVEGLSADTDYFALVSDVDYGRVQSIAAADLQSMTENYDGYLPTNFTEQSQLLDRYRQNLVTPMPSLWKRGGAKVLGWTTNIQSSPTTNATTTWKNIIDGTSTTVSSSTPGWTVDMRYKTRLSQSVVPCVIKVCGSWLDAGSATGGDVKIMDSGGTALATITSGWSSTTPTWVSTTLNLPASAVDKYDIHSRIGVGGGGAAGTLSIYAVAVFEYET